MGVLGWMGRLKGLCRCVGLVLACKDRTEMGSMLAVRTYGTLCYHSRQCQPRPRTSYQVHRGKERRRIMGVNVWLTHKELSTISRITSSGRAFAQYRSGLSNAAVNAGMGIRVGSVEIKNPSRAHVLDLNATTLKDDCPAILKGNWQSE